VQDLYRVLPSGESKKLTGAAEHWFYGDGGEDQESLEEMAQRLGVVGLPKNKKPKDFEVWPEHATALSIFLACDDQWISGSNGVIGLNMAVVIRVMEEDVYNVRDKAQALEDIKIIATRARQLINKAT
jgi:hypothetical protein